MKDGFVKVAVAVPEIRVADPEYNAAAVCALIGQADEAGAQLVVFPELCLTGYSCGDLFLQRRLLEAAREALGRVAERTRGLGLLAVVGLPLAGRGGLYNVAAFVHDGRVLGFVPKQNLPNYAEFYEKRHFLPGSAAGFDTVPFGGEDVPFGGDLAFRHRTLPELVVAAELCEDLWAPKPPSIELALAGATVICNLSASDELVTKDEYRRQLVQQQSGHLVAGYLYAGAGEGESTQDVVYTGHSLICENGALLAELQDATGLALTELDLQRLEHDRRRMGSFTGGRALRLIDWGGEARETALTRYISRTPFVPEDPARRDGRCRKILSLQAAGLKTRVRHTGAKKLVIGVSGGLDSTLALLVAATALDALGRPRSDILAVTMPCFGTTRRTRSNAEQLAERLGAELRVVDIKAAVDQHFLDIGHDPARQDVTYENAQARERTQVLMDLANEHGGLVVGTGDLSELALGWATYNGDHMSMYGVNASVPKMLVRHLVRYYADTTPDRALAAVLLDVLDTPVSPELLPPSGGEIAQKTEDLVGPYELHDFFLYYVLRWGFEPKKIDRLARYAFAGVYDGETIRRWLCAFFRRFFAQQFKRSCLPDGPKVGSVALSPRGDWRMPSDASRAAWQAQLDALQS